MRSYIKFSKFSYFLILFSTKLSIIFEIIRIKSDSNHKINLERFSI